MKKILMLCLALVMGVGMCAAEKPANKKTVTTVFTTDIDCEHCVKKIMNNVPSLGKGVKDVQVDLPKKEVTVVYDGTKNNDENIVKGFASLKVKAEPKKADGRTCGPPFFVSRSCDCAAYSIGRIRTSVTPSSSRARRAVSVFSSTSP